MAPPDLNNPPTQTMTPLAALSSAWALSDSLFSSLPTQNRLSIPITLRNPFIFYFGHLPAFTVNTLRKAIPLPHINEPYELMFSRGRDPDTDDPTMCHSHPPAPPQWPPWDDVVQFRDHVRRALERLVKAGDIDGALVRLLAEHEAMHVETLYYMLSQMNHHPAHIPSHIPSLSPWEGEWLTVPAGHVALGRGKAEQDFDTFGWDNEFHPAVVHVPQFEIMRHAVTIASFKMFVDAGGYKKKELWELEDWEWLKREGMKYPATWRMIDGVLYALTNAGPHDKSVTTNETDVTSWPVSVSLAEARAYARWIGGEIPTEAQWMRAAGTDETTWAHRLAPAPVTVEQGTESWCGVVAMVGNGWELTSSVLETFDGFVPMELYPEYSQDFFDGKHYVVKGASWATHPVTVRPTFRNFYQARYPFVFSKFRLVRKVGER